MTENAFKERFGKLLEEYRDVNTADNAKEEILRHASYGLGDNHTTIVKLNSGLLKLITCRDDEEDADSVATIPLSAIETISTPCYGCFQFWCTSGDVFQIGQYR